MTPRRVLVTGGGSGIGLAAVMSLYEAGAEAAIVDLRFDRVPQDLPARRILADVTKESDVQRAFAEATASLGGLDVVIHSVGIMREQHRDISEITLESWRTVIEVNLTAAFLVARATVATLAPSGGGVLILIGSGAGTTGPSGSIPYGASKGGINGLAMTLADQVAPQGIRVHNFLPGSIDTPLIQGSFDEALCNGASRDAIELARGRLSPAASVGRILAFLASEEADAVRGNVNSQ